MRMLLMREGQSAEEAQLVDAAAATKGAFMICSAAAGSSLPLLLNGNLPICSSCCMAAEAGKQAGQHVGAAPPLRAAPPT